MVKEYAEGNWEAVTRHFPGRSLFQVHRRWNDYLVKPQLKTGPWSTEEDAQLVSLVQQHGGKWTLVAQYMDGRHANHCRQRYSYKLNPELNHGDWSAQEDEIVLDRKNNFNMTWREIAVLLPGRCCAQVKQRYSILARPEGGKRKRRKTEKVKKKEGGMEGLAGGDSSSEDEGWQHDLLSAPVIRIVEEVQAEEENEVEVKEKPAKKPRGRAAGPAAANLATMAT
ncbi:hypothetical protein EON63_03140 [archaeon]|nr:MAG: hypothetical protein EON63_03140 [archaeon]